MHSSQEYIMKKLPILMILFFTLSVSHGAILNVPTASYPNIQTAIDSAAVGDTVLVEPGTYTERIDFLGKNIVVAGRYLTDPDTGHISNTIIDGQSGGSVVTFQSGEDSSAKLIGFTIINGFVFPGDGAGIRCINGSGPTLEQLIIRNNISGVGGGLFAFSNSHIRLRNVVVKNNRAFYSGGGIYCDRSSSIEFNEGSIMDNTANEDGGGLYLSDSSEAALTNVSISNNYASYTGGAMFASVSAIRLQDLPVTANGSYQGGGFFFEDCYEARFTNTTISGNVAEDGGGAILALESTLNFQNSRIHHNHAYVSGGGIYAAYSGLIFDENARSDIFLNFAGLNGNDLYAETDSMITVALDTATILPVTGYQVFPQEFFTIEALSAKVSGGSSELYVSRDGSDQNDGLTPETSLATIAVALTKISADSLQPGTIHLQPGIYGNLQNNDYFPLNMRSFTKISGNSPADVVLEGDYTQQILGFADDHMVEIENVRLQNAYGYNGGAVYMNNSQATFHAVIFQGNNADVGSALYLENDARADLLNGTFVDNPAYGVVYLNNADASIVNSIFWMNGVDVLVFDFASEPNSAVIAYSDIEGGQENLFSTTNGSLFWLDGNFNQSPMFEDSVTFDLRLQTGSPCIDAGRQDTVLFYNEDLDSLIIPVLAFNDNAPDMGALESGEPNSVSLAAEMPDRFILYQNYPNPFNPSTTIRYRVARISDVKITVYNTLGQMVRVYEYKGQAPGMHEIVFQGTNLASGLYYYVATAENVTFSRKMLLLK